MNPFEVMFDQHKKDYVPFKTGYYKRIICKDRVKEIYEKHDLGIVKELLVNNEEVA